jgi:NAD(P)-dependent dehydrogenase (short-subunit alcohol dehydrogenase family)
MPDQQKYTNKLEGKRVLVVGGSAGIGYGVAEATLEYGAKVIISSSNPKRIEAAIQRLQAAYPSKAANIKGYTCDLGGEDVEANLAALLKQAGDVDHVVFSAGDMLRTGNVHDIDIQSLVKSGQLRFFAPLLLAKHLPKSTLSYTITGGRVALKPIKNWAVVGAYASGLHGMVRGLALDLAPIRVNLVEPGGVDTEFWRELIGVHDKSPEEAERGNAEAGKANVTGRVGRVEDVVEGYLAFMRDENATGVSYSTEGGNLLM